MQANLNYREAFNFLDLLDDLSLEHALMGGVAVGVWSQERFTKDIDFTVALDETTWPKLQTRLTNSKDVIVDLIAEDRDAAPGLPYLVRLKFRGTPIDLIVSLTDYQKSLLSRKVFIDFAGRKIAVVSPEDLIVSKLIAKRPQDLVDIDTLLNQLQDLDFDYISHWAKEWDVLQMWEEIQRRYPS